MSNNEKIGIVCGTVRPIPRDTACSKNRNWKLWKAQRMKFKVSRYALLTKQRHALDRQIEQTIEQIFPQLDRQPVKVLCRLFKLFSHQDS